MAGEDTSQRLTVSEKRVAEIVENAILRLQLHLQESFALKQDVARVEGDLRAVAQAAEQRHEEFAAQLKGLQEDKVGRDAVTDYKKWLSGGAILMTVFMGLQFLISIFLILHHGHL